MTRDTLDLLAPGDPDVERIWRALETQASPTYFQSWGWISTWLAALPADERPSLGVIHDGRAVASAFFLAQRRVRRSLVLQKTALYFNASGTARHDDVIAHNAMLTAPGARRSLAHVLDLLPADWDELHLPAIDRRAFDDLEPLGERYKLRLEREQLAPVVDLAAVREARGDVAAIVAPRTRRRLALARHALRDVCIDVAGDDTTALSIWSELLRLQARAAIVNCTRAPFADAWTESLHRRLIRDRLAHGEIELVRVRRGDATLGCVYQVVLGGRVRSCAIGVAPSDADAALVCQAAVVEHAARVGHATYDLADEALATGADRRIWLTVERPLARIPFEQTARRWVDAVIGERRLALAR